MRSSMQERGARRADVFGAGAGAGKGNKPLGRSPGAPSARGRAAGGPGARTGGRGAHAAAAGADARAGKRQRGAAGDGRAAGGKDKSSAGANDNLDWISSDEEVDTLHRPEAAEPAVEDEFASETADEKRIRLAKSYLSKLESGQKRARKAKAGGSDAEEDEKGGSSDEDGDGSDDEEARELAAERSRYVARPIGVDVVGEILHKEVQTAQGRITNRCAAKLSGYTFPEDASTFMRGHNLPPTCVALSHDGKTAFTGGKDSCIIRWDLETGKKIIFSGLRKPSKKDPTPRGPAVQMHHGMAAAFGKGQLPGHRDQVLALAVSSDDRYLASGGLDKHVCVWDIRTNQLVEQFSGHRQAVSALAFRQNSHQLFSGSHDRTVKIWSLDEMAFIDTLFGHQSEVQGLDSLVRERAVSVGSDGTVRLWKILDSAQLVFRSSTPGVECVKMLDESTFVTGAQSGELALWHISKKKPVSQTFRAHGTSWVSALAVAPNTDLIASGGADGHVRFWRAGLEERGLVPLTSVAVPGYVSGLVFDRQCKFLVASVGQEHRLGRWWQDHSVQNGIRVIKLPEGLQP